MNLGNFFDYIPIRTFADYGDIYIISSNLAVAPWWIMVLLGYPICYGLWYFYAKLLPLVYHKLVLTVFWQSALLLLITVTLFVFFGGWGHQANNALCQLWMSLSFYSMPIVLIACWPQRAWVRDRVNSCL